MEIGFDRVPDHCFDRKRLQPQGKLRKGATLAISKRADGILAKRAHDTAFSQPKVSPLLTMFGWS
jgi:hypothetical protein